jgi:hypothetical protein
VSLNLLAFAIHTVCDIGDDLWRTARTKLGPRYNFFNKLAAITIYLIFTSWEDLLLILAFAKPPPIPQLALIRPAALVRDMDDERTGHAYRRKSK